jgi:hypothetical protein
MAMGLTRNPPISQFPNFPISQNNQEIAGQARNDGLYYHATI